MQTIHLTLLFAGLFALFQCFLTALVIVRRIQTGIHLMDGGDAPLIRRIRAHGNFAETVPISLLLILVLELGGLGATYLWWLGSCLLAGRILHAGCLVLDGLLPLRQIGMALTITTLSFGGVLCIAKFLG